MMFHKTFGSVTIQLTQAPKRGQCLQASLEDGTTILIDCFGMNPMLVPDGTNAYWFGNKLILVTRWSDMNDEEKATVESGKLKLALHPYRVMQASLKIDGKWSDVMPTLPHCCDVLNDETAPVDELILVFADTHDSCYVTCRSVQFPAAIQKFLRQCLQNSHKEIHMDDRLSALQKAAEKDASRDFWDYLYDACWEEVKDYSRSARAQDPESADHAIYVEIDENNRVTNFYQHIEKDERKPAMSAEVEMYWKLAEKGIADAQYNLGVCFEQGDGVAADPSQAVSWYRKAADQGHAKAQHNLGVCLFNGIGTSADQKEAVRYFRLSAEQGDMYAQFNLGVAYYNGTGVEQSIYRAAEWFQKAAEQGHPSAKQILGMG